MNISLKSPQEIQKLKEAGQLAAEVLEIVSPFVKPGISTYELDEICFKHITENQNAIPGNIGYNGYEKTTCISVNQVICHGIPSKNKICLLYTSPSPRD